LSFPWTLLGWHFWACFTSWLMVHLTWFLNIFEIFLTLKIQLVVSFNFTSLCSHVTVGHIFGSLVWIFGVSLLLVLAKPSDGIHLIIVGEASYQLMNKDLHVYSFMMRLFFTCHYLNLGWQLKEVLRSWSMVFGPFWVPILIKRCFK
jgi:hypothetical protein